MGGNRWVLLSGLGVLLAGCGGGTGEPAFQVRDSSGVEIVESFRPLWGPGEGRRFAAEPILRIGVVEGDPDYQFVEVTGVAKLADGTVVVADFGSQNVRFFDSEGRIKMTFGGAGDGPREFQGLSAMGLGPDGRIWLYDFMLRRITWLDAIGDMADLTSLDPEPPMLHPLGVLADGTFLLKQLWGATQVAEASQTGFRRDPVAFVKFDGEGALVDTLCLLPGRELFLTDEDGRGVMSTPPFANNSTGWVWGGAAVVGSTEALDLSVLGRQGEPTRIIRLPDLDLTLAPEDREEYLTDRLAGLAEEDRPRERARLEEMPFPATRPAFGALLPDEVGNLWVGQWALAPKTPEHWKVFDPSGRWLGVVTAPRRFFPYVIGDDWVLGVEWDALDVEYVVMYPLLKGQGDG